MNRSIARLGLGLLAVVLSNHAAWAIHVVRSTTLASAGLEASSVGSAKFSPDGSLYVAGVIDPPGSLPYFNGWLARFDSNLNLISSVTLAPAQSSATAVSGLEIGPSGEVWLCGRAVVSMAGDIFAARFNSNLVLQASAAFTGRGNFNCRMSGSELVVTAMIEEESLEGTDFWIGKIDANAVLVASRVHTFDYAPGDLGMAVANDGDIWIALPEMIGASPLADDIRLLEVAPSLVVKSSRSIDFGGSQDFVHNLDIAPDGRIWAIGYGPAFWVARFDSAMTVLSSAAVGSGVGFDLAFDGFGNAWAAGSLDYGFKVLLLSDEMSVRESLDYNPSPGLQSSAQALVVGPQGTVYVVGQAGKTPGESYGKLFVAQLALAPERLAEPSPAAISSTSIAWAWQAASTFPADSYRIYRASSGALVGTSSPPSFTETGLVPNSPYGARVAGINASGTGELSAATTVFTHAAPPQPVGFSGATGTELTVGWAPGGNPSGTRYTILLSSGASPETNGFSGNRVTTTTAESAQFTGLSVNTTYYAAVRALNEADAATPFIPIGSAATARLASPGSFRGRPLGVSSVAWTWEDVEGETVFRVQTSTGAPRSGDLAAGTTSWIETGLLPNTTHQRLVVAFADADFAASAATSAVTAAAPPSALAPAAVHASSATLAWSWNGNPEDTVAELQRSTDGIVFAGLLRRATTAALNTDLLGCTSYHYRVRHIGHDGAATAFDGPVTLFTAEPRPLPALGFSAEPLAGNKVRFAWVGSPSEGIAGYRLYSDSGTGIIDYSAPIAALSSTETSHTATVLPSSGAYLFTLRAMHRCGLDDGGFSLAASAASAAELGSLRAAIKAPQPGMKVSGNRVAVVAEPLTGDQLSPDAVRFEYKVSSASAWSPIASASSLHPNPDAESPYFLHWDTTGFDATEYDLRAVAIASDGSPDSAPPMVRIRVEPVDPDVLETDLGGGRVEKRQKVYASVANTVRAADASSSQWTAVTIPAGALADSTATLTLVNRPAAVPAAPEGAQDIGIVSGLSLSNGQSALAGGQTALVSLAYPDEDGDGVVDGTAVRTDRLRMFSAQTAAGPWVEDLSGQLDPGARTMTGRTSHFSFFALFAPAASGLDSVRVYPIPYRPNNGYPDDGLPYSPGNPNSGILFDNLPSRVRIRIYTLLGQEVASFDSDNSLGRLQWDVRNQRGQGVASGGYLAVIESPDGGRIVRKLLIAR